MHTAAKFPDETLIEHCELSKDVSFCRILLNPLDLRQDQEEGVEDLVILRISSNLEFAFGGKDFPSGSSNPRNVVAVRDERRTAHFSSPRIM